MPTTSVGRVASLMPVVELLEEIESVYADSEANFSVLPRQLKDNLSAERSRSLFQDLGIFLMTVSPDERARHRQRLAECLEGLLDVVESERSETSDSENGVLFDPEDLQIVRSFLKALPLMRGRRNRRELERFFDAIMTNDLAYVVIKHEPARRESHIEIRFAHHLPADTARALKLPVASEASSS